MSEAWPRKPVGPRIAELPKSVLPAGRADEQGAFPFFCSSPEVKRIDRAISTSPSILMGTGGVATVHIGLGPHAYSTDTWAFTVSDNTTDLQFLYRQIEHRLPQIDYAGFEGSGLRHLQKEYIRQLRLLCPPKTEQECVVKILDTLDTAIHETEAIIAKLKAVKQGLLHDLLTRGIDANGELRPPQAEAPHLYKQSPLGWIPKVWGLKPLEKILAEPTKNGLYKPSPFHGRGPLMVQMGGLFTGDAVTFGSATRVHVTPFEFNTFRLAEGDLLFARRSLVFEGAGQCVIVRNLAEPATFESSIVRVRVRRDEADPEFVCQFLRAHRSNAQRRTLIRQVAVSGVSGADIRELLIALPSLEEQGGVITRLQEAQTRINLELESVAKLRSQKTGLMDDLLTGRVRVTPLLEGVTP
jgi:type I restriction enzyme S subunit